MITVMLCMTNQTMKVFVAKLDEYSTMLLLLFTGAIRGTSQTELYNELGLESLKFRRWFRRLRTFFKIKLHGKPEHLLSKIPSTQIYYNTRNADQFETYYCRTDVFKNSFFLIQELSGINLILMCGSLYLM